MWIEREKIKLIIIDVLIYLALDAQKFLKNNLIRNAKIHAMNNCMI